MKPELNRLKKAMINEGNFIILKKKEKLWEFSNIDITAKLIKGRPAP